MMSMVLKWRILKTPEETQQALTEAQHELEKAMTTLAKVRNYKCLLLKSLSEQF